MRCDLHVHTIHSGMCTLPVFSRFCRESYSDPLAVYETLKRRGMDLVTVTDHDSIDAAEQLRGRPDFVLSEEVSAVTPSGTHFHMGVYNISERDHLELQRRRNDFESLSVYLGERRLWFSINHVFSSLTGSRTRDDFDLFGTRFPAVEILNGQMPPLTNRAARDFARRWGKPGIAGSDAHTLGGLGSAYTEVKGARTKEEFFAGLRMNLGRSKGAAGGWWKLTGAVLDIGVELMRVSPWTRILAPLMIAAPAVIAVQQAREMWFARYWLRKLAQPPVRPAHGKPFDLGRPAWEG